MKRLWVLPLLFLLVSPARGAITFDDVDTGGGTGNFGWTYTSATDLEGILIFVVQTTGQTEEVLTVKCDSIDIPEVTSVSPSVQPSSEPGTVYAYFLGAGLGAGDQSCAITVDGTGSDKIAYMYGVHAADDTSVVTAHVILSAALDDPRSDGTGGRPPPLALGSVDSFVACGSFSGLNSTTNSTAQTNWLHDVKQDVGSQTRWGDRYTVIASDDVTTGYDSNAAQDVNLVCVAIREGIAEEGARRVMVVN